MRFESWGRFPQATHLGSIVPGRPAEVAPAIQSAPAQILPRGLGRSYGDSCLNDGGYLLLTKWLNKIHAFDAKTGLLRCESGVTFDEILQVFVPQGWFLPVTPGTKFVTVGGAIANDIHGKNHHQAGNFGNHVAQFELLRSDGSSMVCSKDNNADWFHATIGGLGLTGIILWAEFRLKPIAGPYIEMESIRFKNLEEFFSISAESAPDHEYTVAWLDCLSAGDALGRGIFMRGNHAAKAETNRAKTLHHYSKWKTFPFDAPPFFLSSTTIRAFNLIYYNRHFKKRQKQLVHYDPFFYPLDKIRLWNRMYGKRGFLQWQCVIPPINKNEAIKTILSKISASQLGSFLVVLKEFGTLPAAGMLSFPMPGTTLALDFANVGERLFSLLRKLDEVVTNFGGRIYPAKDARMSRQTFRASFSEFENFAKYLDPKFSSDFFRRVRA
jgi:FAD/FMN-containing dehydrogenase